MLCPSFEYGLLNSETYAKSLCTCSSPVMSWFLNGKLPETITVTPGKTAQVVRATAKNRYLEEVIVAATSSASTGS